MQQQSKKLCALVFVIAASSVAAVNAADSTHVKLEPLKPVGESYMLAHGRIKTNIDAYQVNIIATSKRCSDLTEPQFTSNIASIDVYGAGQAIEGVHNTLVLNPGTYEITGEVRAPVNVAARDNGAMVNWQIWCRPPESA